MNKGKLIVISGPSGVGKGTILKEFINDPELNLAYSVSMTTREKRSQEIDGINYHFVTREQFEQTIHEDGLLEWAEFVGNLYGTPMKSVEKLLNEGKNVILEIEVEGCVQVQEKCPEAITIFVTPPSLNELKRRIEGRNSEPEEIIQQRLEKARNELKLVSNYKYSVCNDDPILAADIIRLIIKRHIHK
ncbi:MAG: guanylate kinase [Erysipelotrichaceae bacterium]